MVLSRRGFLGAILAAAVAPAIVRASSLMPVRAPEIWTPPDTIYTGELGRYEGIRIIQSEHLPDHGADAMKYMLDAQPAAPLTLAVLRRAVSRLRENAVPAEYFAIAPPCVVAEWRRILK
jgi:hypothetical protein